MVNIMYCRIQQAFFFFLSSDAIITSWCGPHNYLRQTPVLVLFQSETINDTAPMWPILFGSIECRVFLPVSDSAVRAGHTFLQ